MVSIGERQNNTTAENENGAAHQRRPVHILEPYGTTGACVFVGA